MIRRGHHLALRRHVLLGLIAAAASGGISLRPEDSFARRIRYLLLEPPLSSREAALAWAIVCGRSSAIASVSHWSDAELFERIRANIEEDYRRGRTVRERGWWISATEATALELQILLRSSWSRAGTSAKGVGFRANRE